MTDVELTVRLPEALVARAKARGVLNDDRIARLLEAEVERVEQWEQLSQSLEPARAAFRAEHPGLSEDDLMAIINDLVHEVRDEARSKPDEPGHQ
jgi:DNA-binding transcriptional regulator YiaG